MNPCCYRFGSLTIIFRVFLLSISFAQNHRVLTRPVQILDFSIFEGERAGRGPAIHSRLENFAEEICAAKKILRAAAGTFNVNINIPAFQKPK